MGGARAARCAAGASPRASGRAQAVAFAALALAGVASCRERAEEHATPDAVPSRTALPTGEAAGIPSRLASGRIVVVVDDVEGGGASIVSLDPSSGSETKLWTIPEALLLTKWQVSPDGGSASYVVEKRGSADAADGAELFVRGLTLDADPVPVAGATGAPMLLSGLSWSPDSQALVFAARPDLEEEGLTSGYPGPRTPAYGSADWAAAYPHPTMFTLRAYGATLDGLESSATARGKQAQADQLLSLAHEMPGAGAGLELVAWSPEESRMAFVEASVDGGPAGGILLVDVSAGEVFAEHHLDTRIEDVAFSPDGRLLAVASAADPARIWLLACETGELQALAEVEPGWVPASPVWSPDGAWLAWTELPDTRAPLAAPTARVRLLDFARLAEASGDTIELGSVLAPRLLSFEDHHLHAVAFSPDSKALLVAEHGPFSPVWESVSVYEVADDSRWELSWGVPAGAWRLSWVP